MPCGWNPLLPPLPNPSPPMFPNPPQPATTVSCCSAVRLTLNVSSEPLPPVPHWLTPETRPAVCHPLAPEPPPTVRVYLPVLGTETVSLLTAGGQVETGGV